MSFLSDVLIHTSLFLAFLTLFFFTFVTFIQTQSLINDMFEMFKQILQVKIAFSTPDQLTTFLNQIDESISKLQSTVDNKDVDNNAKITLYASIIISVLCAILFSAGIFVHWINNENFYELFISNIIVLLFIAASELFIVGVFLYNFIEIDSDFLVSIVPYTNETGPSNPNGDPCEFVQTYLRSILPSFLVNYFVK